MSRFNRLRCVVPLMLASAGLLGIAHAAGGGPEGMNYDVGTHIYSPGPLIVNHSFRLAMKVDGAPMKILHADMMHGATMAHPRQIPCMMSHDPHQAGLVLLTCTPGA